MKSHSTTPWGCIEGRSVSLAVLDKGKAGTIRGIQSSICRYAGRLRDPDELPSLLRALIDFLSNLDARLASWQVWRFNRYLLCTVGIVGIHMT